MMSEGNRVRADQVSGDRTTGRVIATGNVAATTAEGDTAYGDRVELTDTLRDAVVDNILLVLERGGRIAAITIQAPCLNFVYVTTTSTTNVAVAPIPLMTMERRQPRPAFGPFRFSFSQCRTMPV